MNWCWVRCFMLKRSRLTSLINPPHRRRTWGAKTLRRRRAIGSFVLFLMLVAATGTAKAQTLQSKANDIRAAMDTRNFERAESLVRDLRSADAAAFTRNNYEYLLARLLERRGARSEASALYLGLAERNSILSQYALWHLALLGKESGD